MTATARTGPKISRQRARHGYARPGLTGQPVLAVRARIAEPEAARFVADALREIHAFMQEHDVRPAGPPFSIVNRTTCPRTLDVEAGWPVDRPVAGAGRVHSGTLPSMLAPRSSSARLAGDGDRDPTGVI